MFRNYLVTALRNIARHKLYSFINIAGLAVGLACAIFIMLFVRDELSYDTWLPDTQHIYRVEKIARPLGRDQLNLAIAPFMLPTTMRDSLPEVTAMTRIFYAPMSMFAGDRQFRENVASVAPNFFTVIRFPLAKGDPATVFRNPESAVVSESAALKYFGTTDAIGKTIKTTANCDVSDKACLGRLIPLKVTGVMRDIPHNSQLDGDVFVPSTSITDRLFQQTRQSWYGNCCYSYVVLAPGVAPQAVVAKMAPILDRIVPSEPGDSRKGSQRYAIHLTPFTDVHLTAGRWSSSETPAGSWPALYGMGAIGFLILLIACFNFMNLSTARALLRAREIGLRKTHGARRGQLVAQFLGEAVLMALLSLILALALVEILLPSFDRLLQHPVGLHYAGDWPFLLMIVGVAVLAGLGSGLYPALVLSGFRPVTAMRAATGGLAGSGRLRTTLVVLQFAVSIGLGAAAIVMFAQISFAQRIDLGFRKDNILVIVGNGLLTVGGQESFVQRLRSDPDIQDVAMIDWPPLNRSMALLTGIHLSGKSQDVALYRRVIDPHAAQFLGIKLLAGRYLSDRRAQDRIDIRTVLEVSGNEGHNVLINAAAASGLGLTPHQAVGQTIVLNTLHLHIVGVLADVEFNGARERAEPSLYIYGPDQPAYALVRVRPEAMSRALTFIDREWHVFAPTKAVWRYFLDENFARLYRSDERRGAMLGIFVCIAVLISALGLFGLAAFTASRRTREIGIRKVFGARTRDLTLLLLWQFTIPVLLANLIAWPIAWYYLHHWLQGFAYRISLSPLYFLTAGAVALAIAWATIFVHAWRVARANPVHALRTE